MKAPLMKSISGIRGIVGHSLDPQVVATYAAAFGGMLKRKRVVVGRDSRPSGEYISRLVVGTLAGCGCDVIDLGIVPTPTVELEVVGQEAAGGVAITASHNPAQWNALKFFNRRGEFITKAELARLEKIISGGHFDFADFGGLGRIINDDRAVGRHIEAVLAIPAVRATKIRRKKFTVVVDAVNGAGFKALPELLDRIGVRVIRINCDGTGDFTRGPEPVAENLTYLARAVKKSGADLGLAVDPDADRLALVDETGRPLGEELTLALSVAYYLSGQKGPVVINLSTSRATADVAVSAGCPLYYTPVGEANVIAEMRRRKAVIGGEGNGGVILPKCHYGRDSLVGAALVLSYMAETGQSLSSLAGTIPAYHIIKRKGPLSGQFEEESNQVEKIMRRLFGRIKVDHRDGIRLDFEDGWIQVRKSNTEPIYIG